MKAKQRSFSLEIKTLQDDGTFEGLLSPYGNVDSGGDVVEAGAFTKSLSDYGNVVPMLWQHKADCPIGELTLSDQAEGLYCRGKLLLDIPEASKAYALLKAGIIKGLSIGYETIKSQVIGGVRHLKELRLYEGSVVTFPMNESASVTSVKSLERKDDFNSELVDRQLSDAGYQMFSALSSALTPLPWSGATREDILAGARATLDQFSEAYLTYLPSYLDYLQREYGLDTKAWAGEREQKEGRTLSSATRKTLSDAHEHTKSALDVLDSLLADEEVDGSETDDASDADSIDLQTDQIKALRDLLR